MLLLLAHFNSISPMKNMSGYWVTLLVSSRIFLEMIVSVSRGKIIVPHQPDSPYRARSEVVYIIGPCALQPWPQFSH